MKREVRTDEIERIRALLAVGNGAVPFSVARTLLAALDAKSAEAERLRRRIESAPPWVSDGEPLSDEQMRALKLRWSTGPERYQADADALIATVLHERAEVERLRGERDQARRAAIEEAIREAESWEPIAPVNVRDSHPEMVRYYGMLSQRRTIIDGLRALLDGPAVRPSARPPPSACACAEERSWSSPRSHPAGLSPGGGHGTGGSCGALYQRCAEPPPRKRGVFGVPS